MRKSASVALGVVAGFLVSFGLRPLFEAPRAEAQPAAAKWEHKVFSANNDSEYGKMLKEVDEGGWEYSGLYFGNRNAVFKRLKR